MAQGKTIKRTIELNYMAVGIDKIKAVLAGIDISKYDKKTKAAFQKITAFAKNFGADLKEATKEGPLSPEAAVLLEKSYGSFIKNTEKLMVGMLNNVDSEFSESIKYINEEIRNARTSIQKIDVDKKNLRVKKTTDGTIISQSQKLDKELDTNVVAQLREEGIIKEKLLSYSGKEIKNVNHLRELRKKVLEDAKNLTFEERSKLDVLGESKEEQKEALAILEEIFKTNGSNLTAEQALQQMNNLQNIEARKKNELAEDTRRLNILETEQERLQIKLVGDEITQQNLLDDLKKEGAAVSGEKEENKHKSDSAKLGGVLVEVNKKLNKVKAESTKKTKQDTKAKKKNTAATKKQSGALAKATKQVLSYGLAFSMLRRMYRETIQTITELDEALTEMAIVTSMSREDTWKLVGTMQDLAKETGFTTTEISKLSTVYFRQGRALTDVIELTTVAAKAARVAGISAQESADYLTSAINGFGLAAEQALAVSDKFAALAATSASSYEELAKGLSKFAAQANVAGISIDFAMGMLAKGVETTREAPETIGTALKTVLARLRELTDYGKTLEDGMDVNRVETALAQMNVQLMDSNGQFRDMEGVLTDLGNIWDTLNTNQQASIAVALAGTRQQSRLIAVMQDFDRTLSLVETAEESAGATTAQHVEYMKSMQAAMVGLQNAWQKFITTLSDSDFIISVVKLITRGIDGLSQAISFLPANGMEIVIILGLLIFGFKAFNIVVAISTAITKGQVAANAALTASTAAATTGIAAMTAAFKVFIFTLLTNPIFLILAALTVVTVALVAFAKTAETSTEKLENLTREVQALNYELNRSTKSINAAVIALEELNNLSFLTDAQKTDLEQLEKKLTDLVGAENLIYVNGVLDLEASMPKINEILDDKKADINAGIKEAALGSIDYEELEGFKSTILSSTTEDDNARNNLIAYYIQQYEEMYGAMSNEENKIYRKYLDDLLINNPEDILPEQVDKKIWDKWHFVEDKEGSFEKATEDFLKENKEDTLQFIAEMIEGLDDENVNLEDKLSNYTALWDGANEAEKKILKDRYSHLQFFKDIKFDASLLDSIGLGDPKQIQKGLKIFGEGFEGVLKSVESTAEELKNEGATSVYAYSEAWATMAQNLDDVTAKTWLYNQAFQSTLTLAQDIDTIASKIENVNKVQQEWLAGTLSSFDLFNFFEGHSELFQNMEDVQNFLSGKDIDSTYFEQALEEEAQALAGLNDARVRLSNLSPDDKNYASALKDFAYYAAVVKYTGDLHALSIEQQKYNETLEQFNRVSEIGSKSATLQADLYRNQLVYTQTAINDMKDNLASIKDEFAEDASTSEWLAGDFNTYFDEVNGTIVPKNRELFNNLTSDQMIYLTKAMNNYQDGLDSSFDLFADLRDRSLEDEKNALDKQKQIYSDYFDSLDRLEKQRDTKKSREDIVTQLQRLEGATDERSRKKALDLQKELNTLNEKSVEDRTAQSRADLLDSFDERYAELETKWALAGDDFIADMALGGTSAGQALINVLKANGLLGDVDTSDFLGGGTYTPGAEDSELIPDTIEQRNSKKRAWIERGLEAEMARLSQEAIHNNWTVDERETIARQNLAQDFEQNSGYSKGGMVDYTGLAQLHGSSRNPEAVLSADQTQMFIGLRDALGKIAFGQGNSESINIEKIEIKTDKLNGKQDFDAAGKILAGAFSKAIKNRGITTNVRK